ncbi:neuronal acetylcholine receptor subunit alpha-7-like [Synchiropus splendidus]|uniref:neuronal acetylcholine receptor subunit alpha-7-like n=1 Tax=Synchiropus splendidus TaxID=270530 RepID=UPI00237DC39C|nr:neuronal acetylcholine receptor subunit alpha-7-like [Synchiropus splendidus]XP_053720901.1 neuronal acetylcholine receptor subunit alpha-7-like [Synchiropus splendidus]
MDVHHLLLCVAVSLCLVRVSHQDPNESRLRDELLKDYNPLVRPVKNYSDPLTVKIGFTLVQILDLDEKNQILTTNAWMTLEWTDTLLQWDSKKYNGIDIVRMPSRQIWRPDILLYNSGTEGFDTTHDVHILVSENGHCYQLPPAIFKSVCKVDVRWFPFDVQTCKLKLGSWTHSGKLIELKSGDLFLSEYTESNEWDLVETSQKMTKVFYECCPNDPYPDVTYTLVLRRRSLFYGLNLIIPCVLLSTLAVVVFLLPVDSGAKISLGVTVLLCFMVLLLMVSEVIPATSDSVPLIAQYLIATMIIVGLSIIATVVVLHLHHHDPRGKKMPKWAREFLLKWCARLFQMKNPDCGQVEQAGEDVNLISKGEGTVEPEVGKILEEVRYITKHLRAKEVTENVHSEWKFAASVLDRLFLVFFSILMILVTLVILLSAPRHGTTSLKS